VLHLSASDGVMARAEFARPHANKSSKLFEEQRKRRLAAQGSAAVLGLAALLATALNGRANSADDDRVDETETPEPHNDEAVEPQSQLAMLGVNPSPPPVDAVLASVLTSNGDPQEAEALLATFFSSEGASPDGLTGPLNLGGAVAHSIGVSDPFIAIQGIQFAPGGLPIPGLKPVFSSQAGFATNEQDDDQAGDGHADEDCPFDDDNFFHITLVDEDFEQVFHFERGTNKGYLHDDEDPNLKIEVPQSLLDRLLAAADHEEGAVVDISELEDGYFPGDLLGALGGGFGDIETDTMPPDPFI
jgi:hypothetical protein